MDIPSLFMIPSAVSSGKVHSVFPNSTDADFDFARSSTATRVNSNGLIESVASGQARLNYEIEGGLVNTKPSLLLEPSRTNSFTYSNEFTNSAWSKDSSSIDTSIGTSGIQANISSSPEGIVNASRVNFTLNSDKDTGLRESISSSAGVTHSFSVYVKGEGSNIGKTINIRVKRSSGGSFVGNDLSVTLTSNWQRALVDPLTLVTDNVGVTAIISSNDATSCLLYGAQLEVGSYATSYIPTNGSTQTRAAETCNGAGTSSIFESSEGILYAEIAALESPTTSALDISISNGATTNYVRLEYYTDGKIYGTIYDGSFAAGSTTVTQTNFNKIAVFWRSSGSKFALNGAITSFTGKTFSANTFNTLQFAAGNGTSAPYYGKIRDIRVYNTKEMTDSEVDILLTKITS